MTITQWFLKIRVVKPIGKYRGAIFPCLSKEEAERKEIKAKEEFGDKIETNIYSK